MLNIFEKKNIDLDYFLTVAKRLGIIINDNLYIKKISENNNGIFLKGLINKNQKILSIKKEFLISKEKIKDFILEKNIDYPSVELFKLYFNSIPNFQYFQKNFISFFYNDYRKKILNFFTDQSPTKKKLQIYFNQFDYLDDVEKYTLLIFNSRAFMFNNNKFLIPILDLVNYKKGQPKILHNHNEFYFKNEFDLNKNDELFNGYEDNSDIIDFYLKYNFIPEDFKSIQIPENFFSLKIPLNNNLEINSKYWNINNQNISNKFPIIFDNLNIPLEFDYEIKKVLPNKKIINQIINSILQLLLSEIKINEVINSLKNHNDLLVHDFATVLKIKFFNISEIIKNYQ